MALQGRAWNTFRSTYLIHLSHPPSHSLSLSHSLYASTLRGRYLIHLACDMIRSTYLIHLACDMIRSTYLIHLACDMTRSTYLIHLACDMSDMSTSLTSPAI